MNTGNLFAHVLTYLHRVGTGLLGNHQVGALATVRLLVQRQLLDGILHGGDIAHKDLTTVCRGGYYDIVYLIRGLILRAHLHLVLLFLQLHRTGRHVEVVGGYHLPHALHGQPVSVQFLLVKIDIHVAVWCTRNRQVTDTVHTVQLRDNLIVQQLFQRRIRLVRHHGVLNHRHHARAQSHHNRVGAAVWQIILHDIHIRAHIVQHLIQIGAPLKLKLYRRYVIFRLRGNLFQVVHRVERVLHHLGNIALHLGGGCSRVGRHHRYIRRVHLRELVDRQLQVTEHTYHYHSQEDKGCGNGLLHRCLIYSHLSFVFRFNI